MKNPARNQEHEVTIMLIANHLITMPTCHTIFPVDKGKLKAQKIFDESLLVNKASKLMANAKQVY